MRTTDAAAAGWLAMTVATARRLTWYGCETFRQRANHAASVARRASSLCPLKR